MKRILYGTTALATAGLVAGVAGDAAAQHGGGRIQMEVSGYMQQWVVGVDQDFNDDGIDRLPTTGHYVVNQGHKVINVDQKTNAEVCFVGQTTLDNGITVGVNVQLEAFREQSGAHIDETFLFLQSDRFGRLIIGAEDNVTSLLTVNAPDGGISVDDAGDVPTLDMFLPVSGVIENTAFSTEADDFDSNKISYITPRFFGFQAGASFTPIANDSSNSPDPGNTRHSGWGAAINYSNVFSNGFGMRAMFGALGENQTIGRDPDGSLNGAMQIRGGAQFSYAGFTVGGGYKRSYGNEGAGSSNIVVAVPGGFGTTTASRTSNGYSWSVGGTYETGPYTIGISYITGEGIGHNITGTGDYTNEVATIAGTYVLGPGIRLRGGFFLFDQDSEKVPDSVVGATCVAPCTFAQAANLAARNAGIQNDSASSGWGGAIAVTASF